MLFVGARQQPSKRRVEKKNLHRLTFVRSLLCAKTENTFREFCFKRIHDLAFRQDLVVVGIYGTAIASLLLSDAGDGVLGCGVCGVVYSVVWW